MEYGLVNIEVLIAERRYPLKVARNEEEKVRSAVQLVNDKIREYQELYAGKDKQDYLAMCLLNFAVEQVSAQQTDIAEQRSIQEQLQALEQTLAGALA